MPIVDRIGSKFLFMPDGCWQWTGSRTKASPTADPYGMIKVAGRFRRAHRIMFELVNGPIPPEQRLDHLCRNTLCVNPAHLEITSHRENVLRGNGPTAINARKSHCPRGHPLSGDNLRVWADGQRRCFACIQVAKAAWYKRRYPAAPTDGR